MLSSTSARLASVSAGVSASTCPSSVQASSSSTTAENAGRGPHGRIGIIGGSGPDAGADLFNKLLVMHRAQLGDQYRGDASAPTILLSQVPGIGDDSAEVKWKALAAAVTELAPLVSSFSVACNFLHSYESEIRGLLVADAQPAAKFVSMTEAATTYCSGLAPSKLVVLGGAAVMDVFGASPYRGLAETLGRDVVLQSVLTAEQRDDLSGVIQAVKLHGAAIPESFVRSFEALLRSMEEYAPPPEYICSRVVSLVCTVAHYSGDLIADHALLIVGLVLRLWYLLAPSCQWCPCRRCANTRVERRRMSCSWTQLHC